MSDFDVARDDLALDALSAGLAPASDDPALDLLHALRADLDTAAPDGAVVPAVVPGVVVPLRRRRTAAFMALAAAAGLVVGGITAGAVAVSDQPGEFLYAAHRAVLGSADHSAADVATLLDQAAGRLAVRDRAGARKLIAKARALLPSVPDADRTALRQRLDGLAALAAEPVPAPTPTVTPSPDRHGGRTPSTVETSEPGDDHGGSSGSSGGSGSDDSTASASPTSDDHSGSDDKTVSATPTSDDHSGSGGGGTSGGSGTSGGGSDDH
jgi:hypothetical protein